MFFFFGFYSVLFLSLWSLLVLLFFFYYYYLSSYSFLTGLCSVALLSSYVYVCFVLSYLILFFFYYSFIPRYLFLRHHRFSFPFIHYYIYLYIFVLCIYKHKYLFVSSSSYFRRVYTLRGYLFTFPSIAIPIPNVVLNANTSSHLCFVFGFVDAKTFSFSKKIKIRILFCIK